MNEGMSRLEDTHLFFYGIAAAGARNLLPPPVDLPMLRTVRAHMFERLSREAGVTLSVEARRVLVELEPEEVSKAPTGRLARWALGRTLPLFLLPDLAGNVLFTFGAGALFARYLAGHRSGLDGPVVDGVEAERVRKALRHTLATLTVEQWVRLAASSSELYVGLAPGSSGNVLQRYSEGVLAATRKLPGTWAAVLEPAFLAKLERGA